MLASLFGRRNRNNLHRWINSSLKTPMPWLYRRRPQHSMSDALRDFDGEELLVLSGSLFERLSSQVFHADLGVRPSSSPHR